MFFMLDLSPAHAVYVSLIGYLFSALLFWVYCSISYRRILEGLFRGAICPDCFVGVLGRKRFQRLHCCGNFHVHHSKIPRRPS